jgi:transglutaminase-like putative cysteine protease
MVTVRIRHRTTYRYRLPVSLGPHRLRLRPRESRDLTLISSEIAVTPAGTLTWAQDVFGNSVATVVFPVLTDPLTIEAVTQLELHASAWPIFDIAASAIDYPFRYSDDEWTDLGALSNYQYVDSQGRLRAWARGFVSGARTDIALPAQGPQRWRIADDRLPNPRRRGNAVARSDAETGPGILP